MEQSGDGPDVDWGVAVQAVARFMSATGFMDVRTTASGPGGVSIKATATAAQVDTRPRPVSADDLRELQRLADGVPVRLSFSTTPFDGDARSLADEAGIALFTLDARLAPFAVNDLAELFLHGAIFGAAQVTDEEVDGPGGGWQRWTGRARAIATLLAVVLAVVGGPFLYLVGRESMRRAGETFDPFATGIARRRQVLTILAGAGTVLMGAFVVQLTFWTIGGMPENPSPSVGAVAGVIAAVLLLQVLAVGVRSQSLSHIPLPRILGGGIQLSRLG